MSHFYNTEHYNPGGINLFQSGRLTQLQTVQNALAESSKWQLEYNLELNGIGVEIEKMENLQQKRDLKVKSHLTQYAPVWLVDEKLIPREDAIQFNVVFQHNRYGWVNRRYRFDAFNNVLYHKGQTVLSDDEVLTIQENEPYISREIADIPNAYGG